jgi:hypothetical protein
MPQYTLLIYGPADAPDPTPEQRAASLPRWFAYTDALKDSGAHLGGEALQGTDAATTVLIGEAAQVVTDGPFAATKDILGGFYLIDVPDLDAALTWAKRIPATPGSKVEVRPTVPMAEFAAMLEQAQTA